VASLRLIRRPAVAAVLAVVLALPGLAAAPAAAETVPPPAEVADRLVVRLADAADPEERAAVAAELGASEVEVLAPDTLLVEGDGLGAPVSHGAAAAGAPAILWAEPDALYTAAARIPNDDCFTGCDASPSGQPELAAINAPAAWAVTTGSSDVLVAVLDTPVDATHPDLAGKVEIGPSFTDPERICFDPDLSGHGTAVAGIVGAATDNRTGVASVGWDTRVLSIPVLDECGSGYVSEIAAGIEYAVAAGADVINLSLVGVASLWLEEAVDAARAAGVLVVAAAGNEGRGSVRYPAAYRSVVSVGATTRAATAISSFSNHGPWVDIHAPGESILTLSAGGGYGERSGTSFATPMVAGAAALVLAHRPGLRPADVVRRLAWASKPVAGGGRPTGWGRLDAAQALAEPPGSYFVTSSNGAVTAFGEVRGHGSVGGALAAPVVGSATTSGAAGYRLVASDGGVFSFGDARFLGSMGGSRLHRPIVGMAATPSGRGYWLVASDGGVFSFGDAGFTGSTGGQRLRAPIVSMAPAPDGGGYWMAAADGGIFTFGSARFHGSAVGRADSPVVDLAVSRRGDGYWLVTRSGQVLAFGNAIVSGDVRGRRQGPVVAIDGAS
jgi:subtilisin family serine protease